MNQVLKKVKHGWGFLACQRPMFKPTIIYEGSNVSVLRQCQHEWLDIVPNDKDKSKDRDLSIDFILRG